MKCSPPFGLIGSKAQKPGLASRPVTTTDAAILGLIQGLTAFLPLSSTAHLLIAQKWLRVRETEPRG